MARKQLLAPALCLRAPILIGTWRCAVPRAGETAALEAYERMVRKALSDGEGDAELEDRLKAAGIAAAQAAAASAAYKSRLPEMRARMAEAAAQVWGSQHTKLMHA